MPGCGWTTASAPSPSAARSRPPTSPPPSACSTSRRSPATSTLVAAARSTVAHDWRGNARKRLPQLVEAVAARHQRQGDLAQSIEPELKEAHGGLRDMTVLSAMAEAWLADRPHGGVDAAHALLLDVRDAVHVVTGRGRDRLGREEHDAVAALLGLRRRRRPAHRGLLGRAAHRLRPRRHAAPRRPVAARPHPAGRSAPPADDAARPRAVLQRRRGRARLDPPRRDRRGDADARRRRRRPRRPAHRPRHARQPRPQRADPVDPWPAPLRDLFGDLLASGPGLVTVWEGLDQVGIVDTWLPGVGGRARRGRSAARCTGTPSTATSSRPWCARPGCVRRVSRPDLLLVAALLHDIGKVRGAHDHSVTGAELTRARRHPAGGSRRGTSRCW